MARDRADHRRLDVIAAFTTALGDLPAAWSGAWGVLAFASILIAAPVFAPLEGWMGWAHTALLVLIGVSAWGALTRIALGRREGLGRGGLQFGKVELRIVAGLVLSLLFLGLIVAVLALLAAAVFGLAGLDATAVLARDWAAFAPLKLGVIALTAFVALGVMALLITRLSLFAPASVGRGQTVALNSMGIANGAFWPLLILWLVIAGTVTVMPWAEQAGWTPWPLSRLLAAFVTPWLWAPTASGALASAYRQLEYWMPNSTDTGAMSG